MNVPKVGDLVGVLFAGQLYDGASVVRIYTEFQRLGCAELRPILHIVSKYGQSTFDAPVQWVRPTTLRQGGAQ